MPADPRATLAAIGSRLERVERERTDVMRRLADAVNAAADADVPLSEVARLAGVSRTTVYALLRR